MKIRRILATAVAVAVTTPAVMLSVTPAFADTKPAAQTQAKPSVAELEKIAELARKAYDDAVAAESAARVVVEAALSETAPLAVAATEARKAAEAADAAKTTADEAVIEAQAALDGLPETATDDERTVAKTALATAETAAAQAAEAKTAADEKAETAGTAAQVAQDAQDAAVRVYGQAQNAVTEALAAKTAADEALAKAKAEEEAAGGEECVPEPDLTTVVTGLPSTVVAGTTTAFSLRVTNGSDEAMDEVMTFASVHATDSTGLKDTDKYLRLQWSTTSSPKWQNVDNDRYIDAIGSLKAGAHADVKMRLKVDAATPAGNGVTFFAGDYFNEDGSCGGHPDLKEYKFDIKAATAGGKPGQKTPDTSDPKPQGNRSSVPVTTTTTPTGTLAATGSPSGTSQIALAAGAAMVMGAGAVFIGRRRKAGAEA